MKPKMNRKRKIIITVIALPLVTIIGFFGVFFAFCVRDSVRLQKPYESTNVEELRYFSSFFENIEMESCKFVWKGTVVFMGGVLEAQVCGRADLTDEYYKKITEEYEWKKAEKPDKDYSDYENVDILTEFLQNDEYYISDGYVGNLSIWVYLSKEEKALYFYDLID